MDPRVELSVLLRSLQAGAGPAWITWGQERLLLALPSPAVLQEGRGAFIARTRRGYRPIVLLRRERLPSGREVLRDESWQVVPDRRICAHILARHPR